MSIFLYNIVFFYGELRMNIVHLSGAFTRDPELKEISTGDRTTKVVNFVLASSRRFRKKDGTSDEETTFLSFSST